MQLEYNKEKSTKLNNEILNTAYEYLDARFKEYQLYCACKQIICLPMTKEVRDGLFKYLLDIDIWSNHTLTQYHLEREIDNYFIQITKI